MHVFIFIAFAAVVLVLLTGVVLMACGGKWNTRYGNKLMVARVSLQGLVLALLAVLWWMGDKG